MNRIKMGGGRNNNVDCFRIVLMVMIVAHHALVHGIGMESIQNEMTLELIRLPYFVSNAFLTIAVNCFFWISGYFRIRKNTKKLVEIATETMCYVMLINFLIALCQNELDLGTLFRILKRTMFFWEGYWFITAYIILTFFAPFLNKLVDVLSTKDKNSLLVTLILVYSIGGFFLQISGLDNAYSFVQAIYMYLIGAICESTQLEKTYKMNYYHVAFIVLWVENGIMSYILASKGFGKWAWRLFSYNNPIVVLMSIIICIVVITQNNDGVIKEKVGRFGRFSLATYILTDYPMIRDYVFAPLRYIEIIKPYKMLLGIFIYAISLTVMCIGIDMVRKYLYDKIAERIRLFSNV